MFGQTVNNVFCALKMCEYVKSFFFFLLFTFSWTSFQGVNLLAKMCQRKYKGAPFCFLPRAPQTLATPLDTDIALLV